MSIWRTSPPPLKPDESRPARLSSYAFALSYFLSRIFPASSSALFLSLFLPLYIRHAGNASPRPAPASRKDLLAALCPIKTSLLHDVAGGLQW